MTVAVITCMTNGARWLPVYRYMVDRWTRQPDVLVLGENGSTDATARMLDDWADTDARVRPFSFEADPPSTPKALARVASAERFAYFAGVWNRCIEEALRYEWDFAYLTSVQKVTPPHVLGALLAHDRDVVAPMLMWAENQAVFYETYCTFSAQGRMFDHGARPGGGLEQVQAVGGTHLVRRAVFEAGCRQASTGDHEGETVPFCRAAREAGFTVWLDRSLVTLACWELATMEQLCG